MKRLFTLLAALALLGNVAVGQTVLTLQPDAAAGKDALLHGLASEVNVNYGNLLEMNASAWTYQGDPGNIRSVFEFDLTSVPTNSTVTSALLSLYAVNDHSTLNGPNDSWLRRVTSTWDEQLVTWNTAPTVTTSNEVYLPASTNNDQDYLDINVTQLVQDMVDNPSTSFGFHIQLNTESYYRRLKFATSDHTTTAKHPKLVVTYTCPGIPTADFVYDNSNGLLVSFTDSSINASSWLWDFDDAQFSNQQSPQHNYVNPGTYNVCLIVTDSCGSDTTCKSVTVNNVGIGEYGNNNGVVIYPNPTEGKFTVSSMQSAQKIEVHDLFGRKVLTTTLPQIDMSGYAKGVYFIRVGEVVRKLVLQ